MRVEAGRGAMGEERDEFPVGMRVLTVDDDPTCLKVIEAMLRQCKYHVTTSNSAIKALKLLRENKEKFDLIVTDVHMPDMDGFKLLELVGLDMDLPVIMLSANGDTKVVMKGITHGACDYLLKPVRMEELKNIWQHVIRKKKSAPRERENSDNGHPDVGQGPANSGSSERVNRKRKDQNEEEEEEEDDSEENTNENENSNTQKKARVVWSIELHRKFMAAVNHLGVNKAVPKRILDLMNVEGLTRENVASHLQKYRLYLKKVVSQSTNLALLGVRDPYLPLAALDNFGDFHSFSSSGQLTALPSLRQNGGLSRKDSSIFAHNSIPHGIVQGGCTQNTSDLISELSKLQHVNGNQHINLLQSVSTTLGLDQLQQQKRVVQEANNRFPGSFPAGGLGNGCSNIPIGTVTNSPLALQALHTSSGLASMSSGSFEVNAGVSSGLLDTVKCNETWQNAIPLPGTATMMPISSCVSPAVSQINSNPLSFSSSGTVVAPLSHPVIGSMTHMLNGTNENSNNLNFGSVGNIPGQWRAAQHDRTPESNIAFGSSLNPLSAGQSICDPISHSQRLNNGVHNKRVVTNMNGQTNYSSPFLPQQCKNDKSIADGQLKYKDEYFLENSTLQGGSSSNGYNFDELVNMIKPEPQDSLYSWMADMG